MRDSDRDNGDYKEDGRRRRKYRKPSAILKNIKRLFVLLVVIVLLAGGWYFYDYFSEGDRDITDPEEWLGATDPSKVKKAKEAASLFICHCCGRESLRIKSRLISQTANRQRIIPPRQQSKALLCSPMRFLLRTTGEIFIKKTR